MEKPGASGPFDPFAGHTGRANTARTWLIATGGQALVTCFLMAIPRYFENTPKEMYARMIVTLGIIATWTLALRTIRARVLELLDFWQRASKGLLKKASESGRFLMHQGQPKFVNRLAEDYVKGSIRRLRIIAAGLTIPFFVMPVFWSIVSVFLSVKSSHGVEYWMPIACFMLFSACIVAGYFYWAIVPLPRPAVVRSNETWISKNRKFRRKSSEFRG